MMVYACNLRNLNEKQEDNKFNVILSYIVSLMAPGIPETLSVNKYTNLGKLYRKLNVYFLGKETTLQSLHFICPKYITLCKRQNYSSNK